MNHELPLISVVIPVYNHQQYVHQALDSVFYQDYPHLEMIMIDDGSQDESAQQIENWLSKHSPSDTRSFTFIRQKNLGIPATINQGLALAKGSLFTILNSDDIYEKDRLKKLVTHMQTENGQLILSGIRGIDEQGDDLSICHPWKKSYEFALCILVNMPTVGFLLLKHNLAVTAGNLLFTKSLYELVGEFRNLQFSYHYDFLLRALLYVEPLFLEEPLYGYRLHNTYRSPQASHLPRAELNEIHRTYLVESSKKPPLNLQAPCHFYWPLAFSMLRHELKMDRALSCYLSSPLKAEHFHQTANPITNSNLKTTSKKKKKISFISHELSLTGAPKLVVDLAIRLKQDGHRVNVISLKDGPIRQQLENEQIPIHIVPTWVHQLAFHRNRLIQKGARFFNSLWLMLKLNGTIIGNTVAPVLYLPILAFLNPFYRIFWYIHDSLPPVTVLGLNDKKGGLMNKMKANSNVQLWFGSNNTREIWEKAGFKGITKYWSGMVPLEKNHRVQTLPITEILSVGTSSSRKGTNHLIEAFMTGILEKTIPDNVNLTIIGFSEEINYHDYHFLGDLVLKIVNNGLIDRIRLVASIQPDQIDEYYKKADLYIQTSVLECLPLAIFQAMTHGLPIITTDVNGCPEAIEDGKTGYTCSPRNPRILLNTILKVLANPEKSRQIGEEARKVFAEKFSIEKNFETIHQSLLC